MQLWLLTLVLFIITVVAFFWARGSSGPKRPPVLSPNRMGAPDADRRRAEEADTGGVGELEAGSSAPAPEPAAAQSANNALAWATFAFSAFGTVSTFVLSLLTYLRQTS